MYLSPLVSVNLNLGAVNCQMDDSSLTLPFTHTHVCFITARFTSSSNKCLTRQYCKHFKNIYDIRVCDLLIYFFHGNWYLNAENMWCWYLLRLLRFCMISLFLWHHTNFKVEDRKQCPFWLNCSSRSFDKVLWYFAFVMYISDVCTSVVLHLCNVVRSDTSVFWSDFWGSLATTLAETVRAVWLLESWK